MISEMAKGSIDQVEGMIRGHGRQRVHSRAVGRADQVACVCMERVVELMDRRARLTMETVDAASRRELT